MDNPEIYEDILKEISIVGKLFDYICLVNPITKDLIKVLSANPLDKTDQFNKSPCYSFWHNNKVCENCIALQAWQQNKPIYKFAYKDSGILFGAAIPIRVNGEYLIAEVVKDVTDVGSVEFEGLGSSEIVNLISGRNTSIIKDAFTRLYNVEYVRQRLPIDIQIAQSENRSLTLFFIRLEHFMTVNDLLGYDVGDAIIKDFSKILKTSSRKSGNWSARYSGVKFIMVMYDLNREQAYRVCRRLHTKFSRAELKKKAGITSLTLKMGFYISTGEEITVDDFIQRAATNIYSAWDETAQIMSNTGVISTIEKYLLTAREIEVALLVLQGKRNQEVGEILHVGLSTVKKHVSNIYKKTGVKSRSEFISKFNI